MALDGNKEERKHHLDMTTWCYILLAEGNVEMVACFYEPGEEELIDMTGSPCDKRSLCNHHRCRFDSFRKGHCGGGGHAPDNMQKMSFYILRSSDLRPTRVRLQSAATFGEAKGASETSKAVCVTPASSKWSRLWICLLDG
jgi:hypothetical protein